MRPRQRNQGVDLYGDIENITDGSEPNVNAQNRLTSALEFNAYCLPQSQRPCVAALSSTGLSVDEIGYNNTTGSASTCLYVAVFKHHSEAFGPNRVYIMVYESLTTAAMPVGPFLISDQQD